ncbi:unnamed protein product [Lymnaea stagnalis]|uniref:Swi5-dependent recombination DNA repair protein 1 homolog n=1 Tax=Lymnaea stagnalis TaxID=6523 RepID=A0AAV2HQT9_LYMST
MNTKRNENYDSKDKCKPETPVIAMSSALKDRLKKCGRYHSSSPTIKKIIQENDPLHTDKARNTPCDTKRKCVNPIGGSEDDFIKRKKFTFGDASQKDTKLSNIKIEPLIDLKVDQEIATLKENCSTTVCQASVKVDVDCQSHLEAEKRRLELELSQKNEQLRKLKMVKMYREKNNLTELQVLIDTWRDVSQRALTDLLERHPEPKPTMSQLIAQMQIDTGLIAYNTEEEGFT